ncbi:MAG: class I SAM-dependent methyltransferase [Desulfobacterales bacterium]|nr:class I SAM-dependent methyltransferase [Desulfobacterales bacterium]
MKKSIFKEGKKYTFRDYFDFQIFSENPFGLFLILSRYKFAAKLANPSDIVIDIGCGKGIGTTMLAHYCREVVGIDYMEESILTANRRNCLKNLTFKTADARNYSNDKKFNLVVSLDVIEHMPQEDARALLKNSKELLTTDGFAVIGTPNINSAQYASPERRQAHVYEYSYNEFRKLLEEHFKRVIIFSMTDETVNTSFHEMAWYFMALCF